MAKHALISKHIVLTTNRSSNRPVYGIILIEDETIFDVIIVENSIPISSLMEKYAEWNPENLEDYYISPGIIDLNTRLEWESYTELTKAAISGGVTLALVEPGYYKDSLPMGEYFCDIGKVMTLEISTIDSIPFVSQQGYLAIKGYLFPPNNTVQCIPSNLLPVLQDIEKTNLTFILDPNLPDPRMLHMVSPFRLQDLSERLRYDIKQPQSFPAAFPDLIEDEDEEVTSPVARRMNKRRSMLVVEKKKDSPLPVLEAETPNSKRRTTELILNIEEIKEENEDFAELIAMHAKRSNTSTGTIFDDLDKRIKDSQMTIRNLSMAEMATYSSAGVTHFISPAGLKPNPMVFPPSPASVSSNDSFSVPSSPLPSLFERRRLKTSLSLVVTPTITSKENLYCYHMAKYSHTWEIAGITKLIEALKKSSCKVHVCNISAASSLNKIRQAKEWRAKFTCEIPASHLTFSSMTIQEDDTRFKCNPPIRNQANTNLLWDLLKFKGIDAISSSHVCIEPAYKVIQGNFQRAANGMQTVGFGLNAVWTTLNGPVSSHSQLEHYIVRLAKWMSLQPAEILSIDHIRGSISKGKLADFVVWKPFEKFVVMQEYSPFPQLSPFLGMEMFGKIYRVYLRGRVAFNEGKFKPRGRIILR